MPPLPGDTAIYLCIDLVLPMGWVNSPPFFCAASETAADLANSYIRDPTTPWSPYGPTRDVYSTTPSPPASSDRLQKVEVYMDDFMGMTQGGSAQQERVTELLLRAIKEIFPSVPDEFKDSISLKKALQGGGSWLPVKEILGWILDTHRGTLQLPEKHRLELTDLLQIPASQRRIPMDKLRRLIGKLRLLHLAVPSAIGHFYHIYSPHTE